MEVKVSDWKEVGGKRVRTVKIGNAMLGLIEPNEDNPGTTYWMRESVARLSKGGNVISIEQVFVRGMATYGVKKLGLKLADGSTYKIDFEKWKIATLGLHRCASVEIPTSAWEAVIPPAEQRVESVMSQMRIAGRRGKSSVTNP